MKQSMTACRFVVRAALTFCALQIAAPRAAATDYAFSTIYSGAGAQITGGAIGNTGTVVFTRQLGTLSGVYTGRGGPLTTVVDSTQTITEWFPGSYGDTIPPYIGTASFGGFVAPTIDNAGRVVFVANVGGHSGYKELFAGTGGVPVRLSDETNQLYFARSPVPLHYSDSGLAVTGQGGQFDTYAQPNMYYSVPTLPYIPYSAPVPAGMGIPTDFAVNNSGNQVGYDQHDYGDLLLRFDGTSWSRVSTLMPPTPVSGVFRPPEYEVPAINNFGDVLYESGWSFPDGNKLLAYRNNSVSIVADGLHGISWFGSPGINDAGAIVFIALDSLGRLGIYAGPNATDKLVSVGDAFDRSIVTSLALFPKSINNDGLIAFSATLADGRSGVYTAAPIPEPSTLVLCGLAAAGFVAWQLAFHGKRVARVQTTSAVRRIAS